MNNSERFLSLYNDLDDLLRAYYHINDRTISVIVRACNDLNRTGKGSYIKIAKKLNMIRVIRNNLIHELDMNSDNLIEITDETIKFLEELVAFFTNPQTAKDIYTPLKDIYCLKIDASETIDKIISTMKKMGHSQIPIINHQNLIRGVFSPNVLFMYLEANYNADLSKLTLKDFETYYPLNKHHFETYAFIPKNMKEEDIDDLFINAYNENKKLNMVFVTKSGKANEPIEGIIVLKDLVKNTYLIEK